MVAPMGDVIASGGQLWAGNSAVFKRQEKNNVIYTPSDSHPGYEAAIIPTVSQKWLPYMCVFYTTKHQNYMVRKPHAAGLSTVHLSDINYVIFLIC